jgi:hypothetical protein
MLIQPEVMNPKWTPGVEAAWGCSFPTPETWELESEKLETIDVMTISLEPFNLGLGKVFNFSRSQFYFL